MATEDRYSAPLNVAPGRLIRAIGEPVRVGSMLWVFTDPHRGHEFAYNRWYERDHYYAGCLIGAWNFAGSRWVATRRHKNARLPAVSDMPFHRDAGSYACLYYLLDGHHDEWEAWSTPQVHALYAADRGFQSRTHYNTGFFRYEWRAYRDPDPVPLELALDHRYRGLVAQFVEPAEGSDPSAVDDLMDHTLPAWLAGSAVASVSSWSAVPLPATKPDFVPTDAGADRRILQLYFLEEDPLQRWDHHRQLVEQINGSGVARVVFAAPFIPTEVGTDRYVDQLW
jgi:hypothetical protein